MVDCAFSQICSLMGDLSPRVRASAMSLLGAMKGVSRRYIEQALDKKQKVVEADRPEVEEKSGSCGAFIHGLEDEFLEVYIYTLYMYHNAYCNSSLGMPLDHRIEMIVMF